MRRGLTGLLFGLAACQTGSRAVVVDERSSLPSPALLREVPSASGVEVAEEEGRFTFAADGTKTYRYTLRYRVVEAAAVARWSRFEVRWDPAVQVRPELSARIESATGAVTHLDSRTAVEAEADDGERRLWVDLPGVGVGARVERTVVYRDRAPPPLGLVAGRYALGLSVPVARSRVVFDAPLELGLRAKPRGFRGRATDRVHDDRRIVEITVGDLPAVWTREPLLPPDAPRVPYVLFSSAEDWNAWGAAWSAAIEPWFRHAETVGLDRLLTGSEGSLSELLRRVQQVVAWTPGPIGRSPRRLDELLAEGRGDALEVSLLAAALMRAVGVDARIGLMQRGLGEDILVDFPDGGALDHAVLYLPQRDVFVDATDRFVPPGRLPVVDQGRRVLLLEGPSRLVRTPELGARDNRYREVRVLDLTESPELTFFETTTAAGAIESRLRERFADDDPGANRRFLGEYLRSSYRGGRLESLRLAGTADVEKPFAIELGGRGGGLVQSEGAETTVFISAPVLFTWLPKPLRDATLAQKDSEPDQRLAAGLLATRAVDLYVPEPYAATVRFEIRAPESLELKSVPESRTVPLGPALYHQSIERTEQGWRVDLGFALDRRRLSADEARALVGGLRELWSKPLPRIVFVDRAQVALQKGQLAEGFARLHRDAQAPGSAGPIRLATALLDEHLGRAAHRWARIAVERAPEDPSTLAEASRILEHDELGQRFGPGFPRDESVRLMRRARRALRGTGDSSARLARLLSVDAQGLPNRDPAELEEAVVLLDDLVGRSPSEDNVQLLAELLFRVGRKRELVRRAEEWPRGLELDALRIAAAAELDGPDAALSQLQGLGLPADVAAVVADRAARLLVDEMAYARAATLLGASLDTAEVPDTFRQRAALYQRIAEGLERSVRGPAEPVFRLQALLADVDPGLEAMQPLFTESAWARMDPDSALGDLARAAEWAQKRAWEAGLPLRWPTHVTLSHTEFDWEGDDRFGFRVQTRIEGPEGAPTGTWFVVRDGPYRIQAVESAPGLLGAQALDWIGRGRPRAARQWLAWAAELDADPRSAFRRLHDPDGGRDRLAWAAAALAPSDPRSRRILERALDGAPPELESPLYEALVRSHASRGDVDQQIDAARAWLEVDPASAPGHRWVFSGLLSQGRWRDAEAWALARKPEIGFDALSSRELAEVALGQGRYLDAEFHLRDVMDRGFATVDTYNQLAWVRLLRGVSMPEDLDLMEKALSRSPGPHPPASHTFACHLVEQGQLRRALDLVVERRDRLRGLERDDWFVIGRALEAAGLVEDARDAYEQVGEPPADEAMVDTWRLVERRLDALDRGPAAR
jgi:tetratricopeptide (TPR) repeat protein